MNDRRGERWRKGGVVGKRRRRGEARVREGVREETQNAMEHSTVRRRGAARSREEWSGAERGEERVGGASL